MPNIKKTKPKKRNSTKNKKVKKTALFPSLVQAKATKNPVLYFQCMSDCCQKGLKGQKITQIAQHCKVNSPALITQRTKQVKELQKALSVVQKFAKGLENVLVNSY